MGFWKIDYKKKLPLAIKLPYILLFTVVMYVNVVYYGWENILWFSHMALILLFIGIVFDKHVFISMAGISVFVFHSLWTLMFLTQLLTGARIGAVAYMFDGATPLFLRSVSLFHVVTPPLILYLLKKIGYDERAYGLQKLWGGFVIILTAIIDPGKNINWVYGPGSPQNILPEFIYIPLLIFALIHIVYLPTHAFFRKHFTN